MKHPMVPASFSLFLEFLWKKFNLESSYYRYNHYNLACSKVNETNEGILFILLLTSTIEKSDQENLKVIKNSL